MISVSLLYKALYETFVLQRQGSVGQQPGESPEEYFDRTQGYADLPGVSNISYKQKQSQQSGPRRWGQPLKGAKARL